MYLCYRMKSKGKECKLVNEKLFTLREHLSKQDFNEAHDNSIDHKTIAKHPGV